MQLICFGLLTIFCSCSLVFAAPIRQTLTDSQEAKHQKATEIAQRLLKEMAEEQNNKDDQASAARLSPALTEREKEVDRISGILSLIDELYPIDEDFYAPENGVDSKLAELDDILPMLQQQISKASLEEQDDQSLPVMDDQMMKAEDH